MGSRTHVRYAVKTNKGYVQKKGSSHFVEAPIEKADLYISEYHADRSALRHGGEVVEIEVGLVEHKEG